MVGRLNLRKLGEATALGLLDIGLEKLDEAMALAPPFNTMNIGRGALFAAGLVGSAMGKFEDYTETMYIAEEPLLIRTISAALGFTPDYQVAPSKASIQLRLRQHGQPMSNPPYLPPVLNSGAPVTGAVSFR